MGPIRTRRRARGAHFPRRAIDIHAFGYLCPGLDFWRAARAQDGNSMKIRNSLRSLKKRHRDNRLVRRKGRVYIINKKEKRFKARQG